jgi:hypothetical protein
LTVLGLLRVWIIWYVSAIPTWRKDIDNSPSNIQSSLWFIYKYLLTFSTWKLSRKFIPVYYLLVLKCSQWGYSSVEVRSYKFIFSSRSQINLSLLILGYSYYLCRIKSLIGKRARQYFRVRRWSQEPAQ